MSLTRFYGSAFFGIIVTAILGVIRWKMNPSSGFLLRVSQIGLWPVELLRLVALKSEGVQWGDIAVYAIFENADFMLNFLGVLVAALFYWGIAYLVFPRPKSHAYR